jgi:hypothetical protein
MQLLAYFLTFLSAQLIIASFEPVMETFERGNEPLFSVSGGVFLE